MLKALRLWHILVGIIAFVPIYMDFRKENQERLTGTTLHGIAVDSSLLKEGDIIFQISLSAQSIAIQKATHSIYSHCGLLYRENGKWMVFEAVSPVKLTPLDQWVAKGEMGHFAVKRLKDASKILTPKVLGQMKTVGQSFNGKLYDLAFEWSDDKIYCSELVWKVYQRGAGIELCPLQQLKDFDLQDGNVREKLKERYGDQIPLEETVVAPQAIFQSSLLETVPSN